VKKYQRLTQLCSLIIISLVFWLSLNVYHRFEQEAQTGINLRIAVDPETGNQIGLPARWLSQPGQYESKHFSFEFYYTDLSPKSQFLYVPRYEQSLRLSLNGISINSPELLQHWPGPLNFNSAIVAIPDDLLTQANNTLEIEVSTGPLPAGSLSEIYIGEWEDLSSIYHFRLFFEEELRWINYGLFLMLFVISTIFSFTAKQAKLYQSLAIAIGVVLLIRAGIFSQIFPRVSLWVPYLFLLSPLGGIAFLAFSFELSERPGFRFIKYGLALSLLGFCAVIFSNLSIRSVALGCATPILILSVLIASIVIIVHSYKQPSPQNSLLFSGGSVFVFSLTHDALARGGLIDSNFMLSHVSTLLILTGLVILLMRRQASISSALTKSKQILSDRLKSQEQELETAFRDRAALEKKAATIEERERITAELHDGVAGDLATIIALSEADCSNGGLVRQTAKRALDEIRMIIDTFSFHQNGLVFALASFKERYNKMLSSLAIEFEWDMSTLPDDNSLNAEQTLDVLRIMQESVNNAIQHGKAKRIQITSAVADGLVTIKIRNSGGEQFVYKQTGYGVRNMHQRSAKLPQSGLTILPTIDGTEVSLRFAYDGTLFPNLPQA
jgi:signal transduction histidine kinase